MKSDCLLVAKAQKHSCVMVSWERRQHLKKIHQVPHWEMWEGAWDAHGHSLS